MRKVAGAVVVSALVLVLGFARAARAAAGQEMAVDVRGGVTSFSGSLSSDKSAPTYGLELEIRDFEHQGVVRESSWLSRNLHGVAIGFLLSFLEIDAKAKNDTPWPFPPGGNLSLDTSGIGSRICALTLYPVHPCFSVLIGSADIGHSGSWRQRYGTDALGLSVEAFAFRNYRVTAEVEWRDQSQTVDDKTTSFEARSQTLALGYVF